MNANAIMYKTIGRGVITIFFIIILLYSTGKSNDSNDMKTIVLDSTIFSTTNKWYGKNENRVSWNTKKVYTFFI